MTSRQLTHDEWLTEGVRRFGYDAREWRFVCPVCAYEASVQDWKEAGAEARCVAFSCIGGWRGATDFASTGEGPCNYAGGGLFKLNPVTVIKEEGPPRFVFEFAPKEES